MKGDFSRWEFDHHQNFAGVLQQQGRVFLDVDWNAQTDIIAHWQDTAAQDAFGPGVAAVPADTPGAFEVTKTEVGDGQLRITVSPGRVWADGLRVHLGRSQEFTVALPEAGRTGRHAVLLEVWREAVSGFQKPELLIEPALGGPDTTERLQTAMAVRLLRLGPRQACENIRQLIADDVSKLGRVKVTFQSIAASNGVCPVLEEGGYTGFEHHLYRLEIAKTNRSKPMFKWSQDNGGLVGRGQCRLEGTPPKILITANGPAIKSSGLGECYLEIVEEDERLGYWRVTYGARVMLDGDELLVTNAYYREPALPSGQVFLRLWNDIAELDDFPPVPPGKRPHELRDGIRLQFEPPGPNALYRPGDYWTFPVRAGLDNPETLLDRQPPEGIRRRRVPLAELHWNQGEVAAIEDCRRVFRPLTKQNVCCSYVVGDGRSSHGDFDSIQEAVDKLPPWGGEICLLPGIHFATVRLENRFNVCIRGCHARSIVLPGADGPPIFQLVNSWHLRLENLWLATVGGTAIDVHGGGHIEVGHNILFACEHAVRVVKGRSFNLHDNLIRMWDRPGGDVAVFFAADDGLIEGNSIAVLPFRARQAPSIPEAPSPDPNNDCLEPEAIEADPEALVDHMKGLVSPELSQLEPEDPYRALGGIQIAGGSARVMVRENWIHGGGGNGVTLGTGRITPVSQETEAAEQSPGPKVTVTHPRILGSVVMNNEGLDGISIAFTGKVRRQETTEANGLFVISEVDAGEYAVSVETPGYEITDITRIPSDWALSLFEIKVVQAAVDSATSDLLGFMYDIEVARNRITKMGLCGIGRPAGLSLQTGEGLPAMNISPVMRRVFMVLGNPVVSLRITENRISHCLQHPGKAFEVFGGERGLGGISLGMCEGLTIRENTIEDNGRDHRDPVCGIYAVYAAQADISDNHLANNGPLNALADINVMAGIRGGIVLRRTLSVSLADLAKTGRFSAPAATEPMGAGLANAVRLAAALGGYAVRIHDNLVKQPLGHALYMTALGPISIANNQLVTDFFDPTQARALAGAVFVKNYGQPHFVRKFLGHPLPGGSVLFCNNQVRLSLADSWTCTTILSADDIAYMGNHGEVMEERRPMLFNTLLGALTLRASDNRLQEPISAGAAKVLSALSPDSGYPAAVYRITLFTYGVLMNNTHNNQCNHCVISLSSYRSEDSGNQVLVGLPESCVYFNKLLIEKRITVGLLPMFLNALAFKGL